MNNDSQDNDTTNDILLIDNTTTSSNDNDDVKVGLLSLSIDVLNIIISSCLSLVDLSSLDIAYCNHHHHHRKRFLSILSGLHYDNINASDYNNNIDDLLVWLGSRKINVNAINGTTTSSLLLLLLLMLLLLLLLLLLLHHHYC